jgi:hypothetical protein
MDGGIMPAAPEHPPLLKHVSEILIEMADKPETPMADDQPQQPAAAPDASTDADAYEWGRNVLRNVSPKAIQDAFEKAIFELTGTKLQVRISGMDFRPKWASTSAQNSTTIALRVEPEPWRPTE